MPNRLQHAQSPYLRQHAHNPVDWYPWSEEARSRALAEDRPIFLSIGYSACHWCHVMERESFEDPETARLMNEGFVNVKVDREERPDVDALYMRAVQSLTGQGGWPLSVFLTPEGEPFYGGTYFPPEPRHGLPSFRQLLEATESAWRERRDEVRGAAGRIRALLERSMAGGEPTGPPGSQEGGAVDASAAAEDILQRVDPVYGGFGKSPKFPQPVVLDFLLQHHVVTGSGPALEAATLTLRRMARAGVRDHLGGGFHRYAVDQRWLVPHFEKMLYDNALLAGAYLRAHQLTGDPEFEEVCRAVLDDLLDDFLAPGGAFFTARDADSEGEEGRFYLWTTPEIDAVLSKDASRILRRAYDVSHPGNFEGRNILHLPHDLDAVARDEGVSRTELDAVLGDGRRKLKAARAQRVPPLLDDKILAGWNGLAIRSLAEAGAALGDHRYLSAARSAANWILENLRGSDRLLHQFPGGGTPIPSFLDDLGALGNALFSLHEATLEPGWLEGAVALDREIEEHFRDKDSGLLHDAPDDGDPLVVRPREVTDSPIPSGNSLAAELRLRLGRLLGDERRIEAVRAMVAIEAPSMRAMPIGFGRLLSVAQLLSHPSTEIALLGVGDDPATLALLREVHRHFLPGRVVTGVWRDHDPPAQTPLLSGKSPLDGLPTAFVCRDFACRAPTTDPAELAAQVRRVTAPST